MEFLGSLLHSISLNSAVLDARPYQRFPQYQLHGPWQKYFKSLFVRQTDDASPENLPE
jgi:hypothetical protein